MIELLFKYPQAVFVKGRLVLLSPWTVWLMFVLLILAAGGVRGRFLVGGRMRGDSAWRLFVAGSLVFFVEVLGQFWFGFRITGEPMRFVPELDMVLVLAMVEGVRQGTLWRRF
jgi:hypothetical protein